MALAYTPPGVTVTEIVQPSLAPLLAAPGNVCIIATAQGNIQATEAVTLTGTTAALLTYVPAGAVMTSGSIVSVQDALNPGIPQGLYGSANYASSDYTFLPSAYTIARSSNSQIPSGSTVYVTYTYTPADYFQPVRLFAQNDVENRFGPRWNSTGNTINSALSFATALAFQNGASSVVCQPMFYTNSGVKQQPTPTQAADPNQWATVFTGLRDIEDIDIFVPVVGQSMTGVNDATWLSIAETAQDHVAWLNSQNRFAIVILGEDSSASTSVAQYTTLQVHAQTLAARYAGGLSQSTAMVAPSKFTVAQPNSASQTFVGGQYAAACLSGMLTSASTSIPLTRRTISSLSSVADFRTLAQKNADASNGLLVIEQKGTVVWPRHAITLDNSSAARRELSVVRSKFRIIESLKLTLDTQVVGRLIADKHATTVISDLVGNVLEALIKTQDLVAYANVVTTISSLDPTHANVSFSYLPSFPINYIDIVFSIDLTLGDVILLPSNATTATG